MEATPWHLVFSPDGTVLAAADGAPSRWVSRRLDECDDAPEDLKEAWRTLLRRKRAPSLPISETVPLASRQPSVSLTVVDAVPLRRVPVDLRALLRASLEILQRQARACDVTLKMLFEDHLPATVSLDPAKIAWAVTALVGNALRYVRRGSHTMPGGSITVSAGYRPETADLVIEVQDDGPGIPRDRIGSVFDDERDRPESQWGLRMVREVVTAHGGALQIQSETETFRHGTAIRLTLPVWSHHPVETSRPDSI